METDIRVLLNSAKVKDIMNAKAPCVSINEEVSEVAEIFVRQGISHVCVLDEEHKIVGIISQKYLYKRRSPRKIAPGEIIGDDHDMLIDGDSLFDRDSLDDFILEDIMDKNVTTIKEDDTLGKVVAIMNRLRNDCLVVVDTDRKVRGVVRENSIIGFLDRYN